MKVVFFSSVLNHHQIPFCNEMYKTLGKDFTFVATMEMEEQRKKLGYVQDDNYPYLFKMHILQENHNKAREMSYDADVMIAGVFPPEFLHNRLKDNKLTFRYAERFFRSGKSRLLSPRALYLTYRDNLRYRNRELYLLCASAYMAPDAKFIMSYPNKMFKWGYFPEVREYDVSRLMEGKRTGVVTILWAGRFIGCKHPEHALAVANKLKELNINFEMNFIGIGEKLEEIKKQVERMGLKHRVIFSGTMPPEKVRTYMEEANIYLFTSDFKEGWGAVLNEAMNSGCAVVANHGIGATPFLIKHGENGLIYKNCNVVDLFRQVKRLVDGKPLCTRLGINAYKTIKETWNAKVASERFLTTAERLLAGELKYYDSGPMSKAD